jgi:hypothetical protein
VGGLGVGGGVEHLIKVCDVWLVDVVMPLLPARERGLRGRDVLVLSGLGRDTLWVEFVGAAVWG